MKLKRWSSAKEFPGLVGMDLAKVVSCDRPYEWTEGEWELGHGYQIQKDSRFHVIAFDFGIKRNMLRKLAQRRLQDHGISCADIGG